MMVSKPYLRRRTSSI